MRRGLSLVELITALVVLAVVLALIVRSAVFHERFQRETASARTGTRSARQAVTILAAALGSAGVGDLEPRAITDTSVELVTLVGSGAACANGPSLVVGLPLRPQDAWASFTGSPRPGDSVLVFDESRAPPQWKATRLAGVDPGGAPCALSGALPVETLRLEAWLDLGPIVAFRVVRRTRFSLYRSSDGQWYLGMRDWNLASGGFNAIQPVAGPLAALDRRAGRTGLHLGFLDSAGRELPLPTALEAGARVLRVAAWGALGGDSAYRVIGLGRAP